MNQGGDMFFKRKNINPDFEKRAADINNDVPEKAVAVDE
jgi:hypothetical protein